MTLAQKLFSFQGRLNRQSWWIVGILAFIVLGIVQVIAATVLGVSLHAAEAQGPGAGGALFGLISFVLCIVSLWIAVALDVKRFHDRDKSGWWVLIGLVPVIGIIWILIECGFLRGTGGDNRFGSDPLAA